ncbi:Serine-protein kinase RsbW [bioreactor metagenome]|uniref:Serine-protein kinase RsbW n=1 Tax=bioreactor metagenome TaxID=1076179 RepID=A0A645D620_9ZZZZ
MKTVEGKCILYGLKSYDAVINKIVEELGLMESLFDIKLILTEALTNAYKHGNNEDRNKPIIVNYSFDGINLTFEIVDCGVSEEILSIPEELKDEDILKEGGKGLFLLKCLCDKVEFFKNTLVIKKVFA